MLNEKLVEGLHKRIIRKFKKRKVGLMMSCYNRARASSAHVGPCHRFFDIFYGALVTSQIRKPEERLQEKGIVVTGTPCWLSFINYWLPRGSMWFIIYRLPIALVIEVRFFVFGIVTPPHGLYFAVYRLQKLMPWTYNSLLARAFL